MVDFKTAFVEAQKNIEANKTAEKVLIVGATKTRDINVIKAAAADGLSIAGENKVQEFVGKYEPIQGLSWHFIGALQTNKVKYIVDKVDMIHSVDRLDLAKEINNRCAKINKVMPVLIEVNVGGEQSKSGVSPDDVYGLAEELLKFEHLLLSGIMTVLPIGAPENMYRQTENIFKSLQQKYPQLPVEYLSMGISGDYVTAVRHGANIVRLGTALFGARFYGNEN